MVAYSGNKKRGLHDVAIWMHKKIFETITSYEPTNERTMVVLIYAKPKNITLIQAYTPTAAAKEEVVEVFYEDLGRVVKSIPKSDIMIMTGNFKGKVGKQDTIGTAIGSYGPGDANNAGERLREFCEERELALINTWFKKHSGSLYTWKSPDGLSRNQIDYIVIDQNWKTIITDCTTYPGADCDTNHHLLVATTKRRLRKMYKEAKPPKLNMDTLKGDKAKVFAVTVTNRFTMLTEIKEEITPDALWKTMKTAFMESFKVTVGYKKLEKQKSWITTQTVELIKEKQTMKYKDQAKYRTLKAEAQKQVPQDK